MCRLTEIRVASAGLDDKDDEYDRETKMIERKTLEHVPASTLAAARPAAIASAALRRGGRVCSTAPEPLGGPTVRRCARSAIDGLRQWLIMKV